MRSVASRPVAGKVAHQKVHGNFIAPYAAHVADAPGAVQSLTCIRRPRRDLVTVKSAVQFPAEFLNVVRGALDRESQQVSSPHGTPTVSTCPVIVKRTYPAQVADFIGLPGLKLSQEYSEEVEQNTMGHLIWSGGIVLARKLRVKHQEDLKGASVLELGCGTGAPAHPCTCRCPAYTLRQACCRGVPLCACPARPQDSAAAVTHSQ